MGTPIDFSQVIRGASGGGGASPIQSFISGLSSRPTAPINVNSINDPHVLQQALANKQINTQQFLSRFQQIAPTAKTPTFNPLARAVSKIGAPFVQSEKTAATGIARVLPGGSNDISAAAKSSQADQNAAKTYTALYKAGKLSKAQYQAAINMNAQNANQTSADYGQLEKGMPTKGQLAAGFAGTVADILTAGTLPELKGASAGVRAANVGIKSGSYGLAGALNAASVGGTKKQIAENAAAGAFLPLGAKVIGKGVGKTGIAKTLTGKDQAVNDLIANSKTRAISSVAKNAETKANLGSTVIKESNKTRIPVVSPTESAMARRSLGNAAISNSDRTLIPVKGESTQVVGKVKTPPPDYIAKSDALIRAYEKESAALKGRGSPYAQQVLQDKLDRKYGALQKQLDDSYGQTSISFTGKSTKVPGQVELPKSALSKEPRFQPRTLGTAIGEAKQKTAETPAVTKTVESTPQGPRPKSTAPSGALVSGRKTEKLTQTTPTETSVPKVAGSASKVEQKAVQANLTKEFENKATYDSGSYKTEAQKAVKLVQEDPQTARAIALGEKPANNVLHESAVFHAVKEDAIRRGDGETLKALAQAPRHTQVSEAAQHLGSEGYNANPTDPVTLIRQVSDTRTAAKLGKKAESAISTTAKEVETSVKKAMPKVSRQDWHDFITGLQCK